MTTRGPVFFEANPFKAPETLVLDERAPRRAGARRNVRAIVVRAGTTASRGVDAAGLQASLDALPHPERVRLFALDYYSRLRKLPELSRFRRLEHLHVGGRLIRDHSSIGQLRALKEVFLIGCDDRSLGGMSAVELDHLRVLRGRITTLNVSATWALLQSCGKLRDLGRSSIDFLTLESCHAFLLPSLRRVKGLRRVELIACRSATDFSWVRECKTLERLVVTATPSSRMDLSGLRGARVRELFLSIPKAKLLEISNLLPHAAVSNGDVWYRAGALGDGEDPVLESA